MPKKYSFMQEQIDEIGEAHKNCKNKDDYRRLECLLLRAQTKMELKEIAEIVHYNDKYISQIISKYFNHGLQAIYKKPQGGNHRHLSNAEEKAFLEPFIEKAGKGQILIVSEIKKEYDKKIGKISSPAVIYRLLERQDLRKLMPRSKNPKANPVEQEAYKKNN